jgi:hypothetical protein
VNRDATNDRAVKGEFVNVAGERFYAIRNADRMPPFFISLVSNSDHWLFISSVGGLTAGRVSPDTALFPYITVDKIHDSKTHTGGKTLLRVATNGQEHDWEPFNAEHYGFYSVSRNLYKNLLGNKLCLEEINEDLGLAFRCTWMSSNRYGFVRHCELRNLNAESVAVEVIDGLQNILPAGTPIFTQTNSSNLVDAYKWTELDEATGLALYTLYSRITDRAEPAESLKANTVFCLGFDDKTVLLSAAQLTAARGGQPLQQEVHKRGVRGAYLVSASLELAPEASAQWQIVANVEQSQSDVVSLRRELADPAGVADAIAKSVARGSDGLARIMASADGFQRTGEEDVSVHHYANVLFNVLRGGIVDDQYNIQVRDFAETVRSFNRDLYERHRDLLEGLAGKIEFAALLAAVRERKDPQLERLCREYLPITFGRRHGDPSRPWNQFAIRLKDHRGRRLLSYQGNWRDIFQNWEALGFSYPEFVESFIAKFVNASTVDGYNPYRITKEGIDWEVEEPDNPWSYIGYWGDHQIIYLQKFLEQSSQFHPNRLRELVRETAFCYANVPYRIKPFEALVGDPKNTVFYDEPLAERIEQRVDDMGADGKLILDRDGNVYQVTLLEKLLVPLLCKLGNLVIDGGIWMNTQRPEWNDANNALVGHGLSMVTLYYMRRYMHFLRQLLADETEAFLLSSEVAAWLARTAAALNRVRPLLDGQPISATARYETLAELGRASSDYRLAMYEKESFSGRDEQPAGAILELLDDALAAVDHSIGTGKRDDGLYHAYNLLEIRDGAANIDPLYPMLEGQVAALSSGAIAPEESVAVLEALYDSAVYRADQDSFLLYPDRQLPSFLEKNRIAAAKADAIPLLTKMLSSGDERIVLRDADGELRFNADFTNANDLEAMLDALEAEYGEAIDPARADLRELYERVFNHKAFTGRSGTMFGFEGLGSIYWHMVAKLLLAVQENYFAAVENNAGDACLHRIGELYYRVREGIGFNKTPGEYGAFPTDPYSHTPKDAGARQPGMTGQVKEEILTRFGELGIRVSGGAVRFQPSLLRVREFASELRELCYLDVDGEWQDVAVPAGSLAFTWCQVPVVYSISDTPEPSLTITGEDGKLRQQSDPALSAKDSAEVLRRSGKIRQLSLELPRSLLFRG